MLVLQLALTLFLSAFLLFWCQPMVAKMVLPFLGGSAAVWTTCVLFFQTMLLAGYVYAHLIAKTAKLRSQFVVHGTLMLLALAFLPMDFAGDAGEATAGSPSLWLLLQLVATIGLPFFVISTTAPLLQNWLTQTRVDARRDPYFLYAASNAGSLLALLIYPLIVEPRSGVRAQTMFWTGGYALLILMVFASAWLVWTRKGDYHGTAEDAAAERPTNTMRAYWLVAAFVPSALMLAVTNHISVNLTSAPFLWIIPLALYLLTFIMAFGKSVRSSGIILERLSRWSPIAFLVLLPIIPDVAAPDAALNWALIAGHLTVLFFGAYICHTALAARRAHPQHLTEFYFWLALGGALGGVFAAIVAPAIFNTILEYPLLVAALPFFRKSPAGQVKTKDWLLPGILAVAFAANWYLQRVTGLAASGSYMALVPDLAFFVAVFMFRKQYLRFGLGFAALLWGYVLTMPALIEDAERLHVARNFFGVKKVLFDQDANTRKLLHGDTVHGVESMDPVRSGLALSYYHHTGPVGDVSRHFGTTPGQRFAVIGLGTGTMAAYASENRHITFIDIDEQVEPIAQRFFTFLRRCEQNCSVVHGDGRKVMERIPDGEFDVIMLDAFSSDSVPAHLLSLEALQLYVSKLKPNGILMFHVSNRYLRVDRPVSAGVVHAGLVGFYRSDRDMSVIGKTGSDFVIAARRIEDLGAIATDPKWRQVRPDTTVIPWTDDYSNLVSILRWY